MCEIQYEYIKKEKQDKKKQSCCHRTKLMEKRVGEGNTSLLINTRNRICNSVRLMVPNSVEKIVSGKKSLGSRKQRFVKIGKTSAKNRQT